MIPEFSDKLSAAVTAFELRARDAFGALNSEQLNWCPAEDAWSVGQCLEHLLAANEPYLGIIRDVVGGGKWTTFWERIPFLPRLWGSVLLSSVRPESTRKMKAPKVFQPRTSEVPEDVVERFCGQQRRLAEAIESLKDVDVDKVIITSPAISFITYSLRDALSIVVAHEERHLRQAERVLRQSGRSAEE